MLWGYAFGTRAGDVLKFDISGPDGWAFATDVTLTKNQALVFRAVGKKRTLPRWPAGTFTGTVTHMRGDTSLGNSGARHASTPVRPCGGAPRQAGNS